MKTYEYILSATILLVSICGCARKSAVATAADESEPLFLAVRPLPEGGYSLISLSPFDGSRDTLIISRPLSRLIVMSTSHIGFLRAIGGEDAIVGVSGAEYVYDSTVRARIGEGRILDIGYDASPEYEKIMALKPELVLTYSVSPVKSQFLTKLESLGIRSFTVNEHLESHPLARASYVRLFGALTGNMSAADSVLAVVSKNYQALRDSVRALMTVPGEGPQSADAEQRICARKILVHSRPGELPLSPGARRWRRDSRLRARHFHLRTNLRRAGIFTLQGSLPLAERRMVPHTRPAPVRQPPLR